MATEIAIITEMTTARAGKENQPLSTAGFLEIDVESGISGPTLWEESAQDIDSTHEEAIGAALAEMRRDRTAHLTPTLLKCLAAGERVEEIGAVIIPHLGTCSWCAGTLREALRLTGVPEDSLAYAILADAEEWGQWAAAGRDAATAACHTLMEEGIGYVYGRDGAVYRRQPDGHEELLHGQEELQHGKEVMGRDEASMTDAESPGL